MFLVDLLGEIKTSWLLFTLLLCLGQSTQITPRVGGWMGEYMCVRFFVCCSCGFFCASVLFVCRLFLLLFLVWLFVLLLLGRGKHSS